MAHLYCFLKVNPRHHPPAAVLIKWPTISQGRTLNVTLAILPPRVCSYICHFYSLSIACIHSSLIPSASIWDLVFGQE